MLTPYTVTKGRGGGGVKLKNMRKNWD